MPRFEIVADQVRGASPGQDWQRAARLVALLTRHGEALGKFLESELLYLGYAVSPGGTLAFRVEPQPDGEPRTVVLVEGAEMDLHQALEGLL